MKYITVLLFILLSIPTSAQSISYGISIGLPYSNTPGTNAFNSKRGFNKSAQFSIGIGFKLSESNRDFTEIRYSTFKSQRLDRREPLPYSYSIRKHLIEIQKYVLELDMAKVGTIDFGFRTSLLLKTDIEGTTVTSAEDIVQVMSSDFEKSKRVRIHLLAKYSIGSIEINDRFRLRPSYVFSFSTSEDINFPFSNTRLSSHNFELTFITNLSVEK